MKSTVSEISSNLKMKMSARGGLVAPQKCLSCGDYVCSCSCPGCEICGGSGYIRKTNDLYSEQFGKTEQCPNYSARLLKQAAQSGNDRGGLIPSEYMQLDWSMVKPGFNDGEKARDTIKNVYKKGFGMVMLFGNFGQAKTLILKISVAVALRNGKKARYAKLSNILDDLLTAYDEKESRQRALLEKFEDWRGLDLLAIDEMDKAKQSEWAQDRVFSLLDERYMMAVREKSITLMAGNYQSDDQIAGYLKSRLTHNGVGYIVHMNGRDARPFVQSPLGK